MDFKAQEQGENVKNTPWVYPLLVMRKGEFPAKFLEPQSIWKCVNLGLEGRVLTLDLRLRL